MNEAIELPITNFAGDVDSDGTALEGCNLEGEDPASLAAFVSLCVDPSTSLQVGKQLFPTKSDDEIKEAVLLYAAFSAVKSAAFILRSNGHILRASRLEGQLEDIYNEMPKWAQW